MKTQCIWMFVLLASLSLLSGCNRLFEVEPRGIYSPIELGNTRVTKGFDTTVVQIVTSGGTFIDYRRSEITRLQFSVSDPGLSYGAFVFYDSLTAAGAIQAGRFTGLPDYYQEDSLSRIRKGTARTIKIRIEPLKGQFQYIVPVGFAKDSARVYYAQGFIKTKISPWTRRADLLYYSPKQSAVKLFYANGKLGYVQYRQERFSIYESDGRNGWLLRTDLPTYVCRGCPNNGSTTRTFDKGIVGNIERVYFQNGQYRVLINYNVSVNVSPRTNELGEVILDDKLAFVDYNTLASSILPVNYYATDVQRDTLRVIYKRPYPYLRFYPPNYLQETFKDFTNYSLPDGFWRPLSGTAKSYTITQSFEPYLYGGDPPTIATFIGSKFLINSLSQPNLFTVFDVAKGQFKNVDSFMFADKNVVWASLSSTPFITLSEANSAYLLNNNLNIYRVTINADNSPNFQNFYASWFPGNSANAISQGVLYQGKLLFLVNDYQLWEFDPSQLTIDFNRPGAVTIVPL